MIPMNLWDIWKGMRKFCILEFCCFKKSQFFKSTNSEYFFTKISWNGPLVSRRNSCIGQGCSSTYMVVGLSNKRAKTTKNAFLPLKWPFVGQPDNHIGWATSLAYEYLLLTQGPFQEILAKKCSELVDLKNWLFLKQQKFKKKNFFSSFLFNLIWANKTITDIFHP